MSSLELVEQLHEVQYIHKLKSKPQRDAELAVLRHRMTEAEQVCVCVCVMEMEIGMEMGMGMEMVSY